MVRRDMLDDLFEGFNTFFGSWPLRQLEDTKATDFEKEFALPGVKREEIKVTHDGVNLWIEVNSKRIRRTEQFRLPEAFFDVDKISVKYENGLLEVKLPLKIKEEVKKARLIEIK